MTFEFSHPKFLSALLLLGWLVLAHRQSLSAMPLPQRRLALLVRSFIVILLTAAMSGLSLRIPSQNPMLVFLPDESRSIDDDGKKTAADFIRKAKTAAGSVPSATLPFARSPRLETAEPDAAQGNDTNIAAAIRTAAALVPPDRVPHIILISDGNQTLGDALQAAVQCGFPVSAVPLSGSGKPEVQLAEIRVPPQLRQGEPFHVDAVVQSTRKTSGKITVYRSGFKIAEEVRPIEKGENIFRFRQNADEGRTIQFSAVIDAAEDTLAENNTASAAVFIGGKPQILVLDSDPESLTDFAEVLRSQGFEIDLRGKEGIPQTLNEWVPFDAVILSDIPATDFSVRQMDLCRQYVRELGGGLMMIGGGQSFGLGGYYNTPLEEILPVRCDFEQEKEKPSAALCLTIDRSGSMEGEKIELAKDAAKSAVELLTARDFVSVIAFDTDAHIIAPIQNVVSPSVICSQMAKITAGGGTNIYPALSESLEQLNRVTAKNKHIILLTDGKSEPGDFETPVRRMAQDNITLSTIGIGDSDNALLLRLAGIGQGRFYHCEDPHSVPQIFTKETSAVSSSALREEAFLPVAITADEVLKTIAMDNAPLLLGYVRTRPKPASQLILASENGDPVLIRWRYGLGLTAAFTSDVKKRWASEWLVWKEFPKFWGQMIRQIAKKPENGASVMNIEQRQDRIHIAVDAVSENEQYINRAAGMLTVIKPDLSQQNIPLEPLAPGRYGAAFDSPLPGAYQIQAVLQNGEQTVFSQMRNVTVGSAEEFRVKPPNEDLLKQIAKRTGGIYQPKPEELLLAGGRSGTQIIPLWQWLLAAAMVLFTADVFLRRVWGHLRYA